MKDWFGGCTAIAIYASVKGVATLWFPASPPSQYRLRCPTCLHFVFSVVRVQFTSLSYGGNSYAIRCSVPKLAYSPADSSFDFSWSTNRIALGLNPNSRKG